MQVKITFSPEKERITLPIQYNHILQGIVYRHLEKAIADNLHEKGFPREKRHFKLFTFSRLQGRFQIEGEQIHFTDQIKWSVASVHTDFLESLVLNLVREKSLLVGHNPCVVDGVEVLFLPKAEWMVVRAISPITTYSTLYDAEGRKKTYYYSPLEKEFPRLISENLLKKYEAAYGQKPEENWCLLVKPLRVGARDEKVLKFKGTVIKAWNGLYELSGPPELLKIALDTGLGSKNSQGFGMVEVVRWG
ncbi:MAG: CRISPR-associated endoribonuclease Cas6 [candidate division WOR-3 bacterium]